MKRIMLAIAALMASAQAVAATDYYVDGKNGVYGNPGTKTSPFPTVYQAEHYVKPGDTIHILPTMTYSQLGFSASGTPGKPITYIGGDATTHMTAVTGIGTTDRDNAAWINANYIVVKDFNVTAPGPYTGIEVAEFHHHIWITNNVAHDSGGAGINAYEDDYVWIEYNYVYDNAKYTSNCIFGSGISVLASLDIDSSTSAKTYIIGNTVYRNTNTPTIGCNGDSIGLDSDGNGIIVDSNDGRWNLLPYHGRTLIANNVVYGNGGRGIHVFHSNHVLVTSNTSYYNNIDPAEGNYLPGEIEANTSGDVSIYDNILYSDGKTTNYKGVSTGAHVGVSFQNCPASGSGRGNLIAEYNLIYNPNSPSNPVPYEVASCRNSPTIPVIVGGNIWGNPHYAAPSASSGAANFAVLSTSSALGAANPQHSVTPDIQGNPRPIKIPASGAYTPPTMGAYELPVQ